MLLTDFKLSRCINLSKQGNFGVDMQIRWAIKISSTYRMLPRSQTLTDKRSKEGGMLREDCGAPLVGDFFDVLIFNFSIISLVINGGHF